MLFEASSIFKEIVLILGDEGEIIELSEVASNYFDKMERIDFYCPPFGSRLKEVAELNNHILLKGKPTAEQITQERWMMTSYQAYFELGRGTAYRMKDRHNNIVYFGSTLFLMHIPRIGKTVQILKLKLLENNIIESGTIEEFKKIYKLQSPEAFCKARSLSPSENLIFSTMSQLNLCNDEDCVLDNLRAQAMLDIVPAQSKIDNSDSNILVSKVLEEVPENSDADFEPPKEAFGKSINKNSSLQPPPRRPPKNYFESFEKYVANQENIFKEGPDLSDASSAPEKPENSDQGQSPNRGTGTQKHNPRRSVNSAISGLKIPSGLKTPKPKAQKQPQNGNNGNNSSFHENNSSVPTTRYSITKNYFHSKAHEQLDCRQNSFKSRGLACLTGVWVGFVLLVFFLFCYKQYLRFEFNVEISEKLSYPDIAIQAYHRAVVFASTSIHGKVML